jgi:hypothetical protein
MGHRTTCIRTERSGQDFQQGTAVLNRTMTLMEPPALRQQVAEL